MLDKRMGNKNRTLIYYYPPAAKAITKDIANGSYLDIPSYKKDKKHTIYIHIPFCKTLCKYCTFIKVIKEDSLVEAYLEALKKEIKYYAQKEIVKTMTFSAIFFGGGTPTILSIEQLSELIQLLHDSFNIAKDCEFTMEGSLSTFTPEKLKALYNFGVNRISMGVQTFNEPIGQYLNLPQKQNIAPRVIENAYNTGIHSINIDLMYDLPNQNFDIWEKDLNYAMKTQINHISLFAMYVSRESAIYKTTSRADMEIILDGERDYKYYTIAEQILSEHDFCQKTSTDWNKKGHEFQINALELDQDADRLSFGVGAQGELNNIVYSNTVTIPDYIKKCNEGILPIALYSSNEGAEMDKFLIMKLRTQKISMSEFESRFGVRIFDVYGEQLKRLEEDEFIHVGDDIISLTLAGRYYYTNLCFEYFIKEPYKSCMLMPAYYFKNNYGEMRV